MSRSGTPISAAMGPTAAATGSALSPGHSRPTSYLGQDTAAIDHSQETPEYVSTDEVGQDERGALQRSNSQMSQSATYIPSRGGTLKKKASLHKSGSVKRSGSRKSSYAGSVRSLKMGEKDKESAEYNSAFYCPVPTTTSPTELLTNRFQAWRKVLKDLINYFRDLHKSYESRSKTLLSATNVINNSSMPTDFLNSGGIGDAADLMRNFHKQALNEVTKARDLENEVILQLTGLRSDLSQKIKEIKSLSGDFKNSVHKEQDGTRKAVNSFQEALGQIDRDAAAAAGKGDPFLIKLGVERQLERQIEEENYLHRAFLNLEASGRELESIVVGEIQKAYNVLAGILKRDADNSYDTAEKLREGPLAMSHDHEWDAFVTGNPNMVDPRQPLRQVKNITYEGKDHPAAIEVKSGMLERKSKYLKNYTPGWYILSPTHLHEFKSADQIPFQAPVMSLYLPEQKLGAHSEPGSSSHKFMLKGRQTGSMHRGHTWIFRAETYDTMMAWFSDIRELTEKRGEARNEFVRRTHARSLSGNSHKAPSVASGDSQMDEDEADRVAFSGEQSVRGVQLDQYSEGPSYGAGGNTASGPLGDDARSEVGWRPQRPQPGGRFPSDVNVTRGLQAPLSPSSEDSGNDHDREAIAGVSALPTAIPVIAAMSDHRAPNSHQPARDEQTEAVTSKPITGIGHVHQPARDEQAKTVTSTPNHGTRHIHQPLRDEQAGTVTSTTNPSSGYTAGEHARVNANPTGAEVAPDTQSQYHEWVGTAGAGLVGAGVGAAGATAVHRHTEKLQSPEGAKDGISSANPAVPSEDYSSAPTMTSRLAAPESSQNAPKEYSGSSTGAEDSLRELNEPTRIVDVPESSFGGLNGPTGFTAVKQSGLPESEEPPRITASIYQQATMPSTTETLSRSIQPSAIQPSGDGTLISGTDIRAGAATGTSSQNYSTTQSESSKAVPIASSEMSTRPTPIHTKSIQTISDLHIPGEFPKSATTPY